MVGSSEKSVPLSTKSPRSQGVMSNCSGCWDSSATPEYISNGCLDEYEILQS